MRIKEILSRLTGISVPIFGVSWSPPEADRAIAKRTVAFLEDRRVLYTPSSMEMPDHCIRSVIEIRAWLTQEIGHLDPTNDLAATLRAMRAACRKFLDTIQPQQEEVIRFGASHNHWASWLFNGALGEMRGVFGVHLAIIAAKYGLPVENDLAAIIPGRDE